MFKFTALIFASLVLVACGTTATDDAANAVDGEPWRQLVNEYQVGGPFDLGIHAVTNVDDFEQLWAQLGRDGIQPIVDFDDEVVVAYAASYSSGCEYPFTQLIFDDSTAVIEAAYAGNEPADCAADENQYLVMVGIDRTALTLPRYTLTMSVGAQVEFLDL